MRKLITFILLLVTAPNLFGQWKKYRGIDKSIVTVFAKADKCFLGTAYAEIGTSTDEGRSFAFTKVEPKGYVQTIKFQDQNIGYAGGGCIVESDSCSANTLLKTINGGESWGFINKSEGTGKITQIEITPNGNLFALSEFEGIYRSTDGGESFDFINIDPSQTQGSFVNFQMVSDEVGYCSFSFRKMKRFYKTIDGGQTWYNFFETELVNFTPRFYFINEEDGFLIMQKGKVFATNNGGATWEEKALFSQRETINQIYFPSNKVGYATTRSSNLTASLYRTDDGGATWQLELSPSESYWSHLHFYDEHNGYAVLNDNTVLRRYAPSVLDENQFKVSPTAFRQKFYLLLKYYQPNYFVELYDSYGTLLAADQVYDFQSEFTPDFLPPGFYYLKVKKDGETVFAERLVRLWGEVE